MPSPSLVCTGQYQAGHPLVAALELSQAGYDSLAVLDASDQLAPSLVCTVNISPYPVQPVQWLSASELALVQSGPPSSLIDVDVARRSITTVRELNDSASLASVSRDRAWLVAMEAGADGSTVTRLYGPSGARTLVAFPASPGHGGSIYGYGGPTATFSPDGSLVLTEDYDANYVDPTIQDLQVFDLRGSLVFSAARGVWAVWDATALYYGGGDGKVYRWARDASPVAVMQLDWLEPVVSPDGRSIAYMSNPGYGYKLNVLAGSSAATNELQASGQRVDPLFVADTTLWVSDLAVCDSCNGGITPTGKVFAYDITTGSEHDVRLPVPLGPLAGGSLSTGA